MAQFITKEHRARAISAVKDGMSVPDAAKTFLVAEKTIRTWLNTQTKNGHTSSTEVSRLKDEIAQLQQIIGKMVQHQESKKKGPFLGS